MARLRFMAVALLALALAGNSTQTGRSEGQSNGTPNLKATYTNPLETKNFVAVKQSCVIYSLSDLGYDADLGQWIAQTIPEVVEPQSWKESGGSGVLRYYAPQNILIVNHAPAVHTKVDDFFKKLKTSLPKTNRGNFAANKHSAGANVVPAQYSPPLVRTSNPLPEPSGYPVPAPVKPPKHLFHFLIRYEGEGIIDDNVVKFMKVQAQGDKKEGNSSPAPVAVSGSPMGGTPMPSASYTTAGPVQPTGYSASSSPSIPAPLAAPSVAPINSTGAALPPSTTAGASDSQPKQTKNKKEDKKAKSTNKVR